MKREAYTRTATPKVLYEGEFAGYDCFRVVAAGEDPLNVLLFKNEIIAFAGRLGLDHRLGNKIPNLKLPPNQGGADLFVLVHRYDVGTFLGALSGLRLPQDLNALS